MSAEVNLVCPSIRHALLPPAAAAAAVVCGGKSQHITNIQEVLKCIPAILKKRRKQKEGAQNHIITWEFHIFYVIIFMCLYETTTLFRESFTFICETVTSFSKSFTFYVIIFTFLHKTFAFFCESFTFNVIMFTSLHQAVSSKFHILLRETVTLFCESFTVYMIIFTFFTWNYQIISGKFHAFM